MAVIERGTGAPLVVVPGIQGHWQYAEPAIDALAAHFRVITFALAGERASGLAFDPRARARQLLRSDSRGDARARPRARGGLRHFVRRPRRAPLRGRRAGIDVGAGPRLDAGTGLAAETPSRFLRALSADLHAAFLRGDAVPPAARARRRVSGPPRAHGVLARAAAESRPGAAVAGAHGGTRTDSARSRAAIGDIDAGRLRARRGADARSSPASARSIASCRLEGTEGYARLIRGARLTSIADTGHLGCNTRPREFAVIVRDFLTQRDHAAA